jgi:hypothetical protein
MTHDLVETRKKRKRRERTRNTPNPCIKSHQQDFLPLPSSSKVEEAEALSFPPAAESEAARNKVLSNETMDNSPSSFASLSSLAEPKANSKRDRNKQLTLFLPLSQAMMAASPLTGVKRYPPLGVPRRTNF